MRRYVDFMIFPSNEEEKEKIISFCRLHSIEVLSICVDNLISEKPWEEKGVQSEKMLKCSIVEHVHKRKKGIDVLMLAPCEYDVLRRHVEKRKIDALYNLPLAFKMFQVDEVLIKLCAEKNIALVFDFFVFSSLSRKDKIRYLRNMRKILQLAHRYGVMSIAVSGARSVVDLKAPRDLASFPFVAYKNLEFSLKCASDYPLRFFDFIKRLHHPSRIAPGAYFEPYENGE